MLNTHKKAIVQLFSAIKTAKLYTENHPLLNEAIEKSFESLQNALENKTEIVIGMVDGELACGEDIYFELSLKLKSSIRIPSTKRTRMLLTALHPVRQMWE